MHILKKCSTWFFFRLNHFIVKKVVIPEIEALLISYLKESEDYAKKLDNSNSEQHEALCQDLQSPFALKSKKLTDYFGELLI